MLLELAELGEPAVIPGVFGLMVGGPRELSVAAAGVIETLVRDLPPQRLPLLELAIRQRSDFHWATSSEYDLLDPTTVEGWLATGTHRQRSSG